MNYGQELWPFSQAEKIRQRIGERNHVLFETGYGPSGLPHIGTFGEVVRTNWVRMALEEMTGGSVSTKLLVFSDDMDALRKVPENVPNRENLRFHVGKSLTSVPDPFGQYTSFAAHNNAMLMGFLNEFGFDYEFASSTDYYKNGLFDSGLIRMAECHDEIVELVGRTLQKERRETYSPFLPIHPQTGVVMQVPMISVIPSEDMLVWIDPESGKEMHTKITGGNCKAQWKADWALRWFVLGVDYEMSGKDLIDSVKLSSDIVRVLGSVPPINLTYELFLDEEGKKISKSVGNGVGVHEWLSYAPASSLSYFMFNNPQRAKKIYFDMIPKMMDEYIEHHNNYVLESNNKNPAHFVGCLVKNEYHINYTMLLNLIDVLDASEEEMLWSYMEMRFPNQNLRNDENLVAMIPGAFRFFEDFVKPNRVYHIPTESEVETLEDLRQTLSLMPEGTALEEIQKEVFEVGKRSGFVNLREWFSFIYSVLLGKKEGPRLGSFIHMYGISKTVDLIESKI